MNKTCFYCNDEVEERNEFPISILKDFREEEKTLCHVCYNEWLEGIKG